MKLTLENLAKQLAKAGSELRQDGELYIVRNTKTGYEASFETLEEIWSEFCFVIQKELHLEKWEEQRKR